MVDLAGCATSSTRIYHPGEKRRALVATEIATRSSLSTQKLRGVSAVGEGGVPLLWRAGDTSPIEKGEVPTSTIGTNGLSHTIGK